MIPFNKPYLSGNEIEYIKKSIELGKISGDGAFTEKCKNFFKDKFGLKNTFLTTSCTDALEMSAILCNIKEGDEVIAPSFTFVSTVNSFILRGAKIIFADTHEDIPNINENIIEELITKKTKVILPVHYAGISCEMDKILQLTKKYNLFMVEDAAQAINSYYKDKVLGSIGDFGTYSFHETKNIISGEGGLLIVNDDKFVQRAEIIREKGTNRSAFFRGEIDKYGWVDIGSSFLPSDMIAAFLYAQLENIDKIQNKRKDIWNTYYSNLKELQDIGYLKLPIIPEYATNNAHMFFIICENLDIRTKLISHLKNKGITAVFHYISLHESKFFKPLHDGRTLKNSNMFSDCLLRLPLFFELEIEKVEMICKEIKKFFTS